MAVAEGEHPLLMPFLALSTGLVLGDRYALSLPVSAVAAAFLALLLSCFVRHRLVHGICTFLFFLVWGLYVLPLWTTPPEAGRSILRYEGRGAVVVEGVIRSRPIVAGTPVGSSTRFVLETSGVSRDGRLTPASGRLMVYVRSGEVSPGRGDLVRLLTRISTPRLLGLPGEFDFARYLAHQGIVASASVATADDLLLMRGGVKDRLVASVDRQARLMGDFIRACLPDQRVSSVVAALLIGDQRRIADDLSRAYTRAGVSHILSISGFHVGILAFVVAQAVLLIATRFETLALRFNLRRVALLSSLPAMLLYLLLTGVAPATARSVVMLALFVLALYVDRETDPVNALLVSAMVLVVVNPPSLFHVSFQLSFLALWGMVLLVPWIMGRFGSIRRGWARSLLRFCAVSCAASVATVVPLLYVFNQASLNGILANFLVVPLLGYGAVLAGFCSLLLVPVCVPLARLFMWATGKLVAVSNWLVGELAHLPLITFGGITALDMLAFLLFMGLATFARPGRVRTTLCLLTPLLAIAVHFSAPPLADGRLHVTMLSVGQGESLLIRLPPGEVMLVDGGGFPPDSGRDFGERILGPALLRLGVRRIDYMVMSHAHPDHLGGLSSVARTLPVGQFWEPVPGGDGGEYAELRAGLESRGIPRRLLAAGDTLRLPGGVTMAVLSPPVGQMERRGERDDGEMNEQSLVFRLTYGEHSFLFTADAGFATERRMLGQGVELASQLLKVGHHGSRFSTSEEFLARVSPTIALISAGSRNAFGLPSPRTLALLRRRGVAVYRTDLDGTVELVSDGRSLAVATPWRPN
jgi:competence protein ComEC